MQNPVPKDHMSDVQIAPKDFDALRLGVLTDGAQVNETCTGATRAMRNGCASS